MCAAWLIRPARPFLASQPEWCWPGTPAVARHASGRVLGAASPAAVPGRHRKTRGARGGQARTSPAGLASGMETLNRSGISRRRSFMLLVPLFVAGAGQQRASADTRISQAATGPTLTIVAHEDDDLIFISPALLHAIQAGATVRTVYLT